MKNIKQIAAFLIAGATILGVMGFSFAFAQTNTGDTPTSVGTKLEVNINDAGLVLVRGARVTRTDATTFVAVTDWPMYSITWTLNADASTAFIRRFGASSSFSEISVGDIV